MKFNLRCSIFGGEVKKSAMKRLIEKILIIGFIGIIFFPCSTGADDDFDLLLFIPAILSAGNSNKVSICGAYIAPGVYKEFDCYNLAAIGRTTGDDPFTPSWRLIGGYWQWGRKGPDPSQWYDTNTPNFAHGPTGIGSSEANSGEIDGWGKTVSWSISWQDAYKNEYDPCLPGYRVPTKSQWRGIIQNNEIKKISSWVYVNNDTNYNNVYFFGNHLMLPVTGIRHGNYGGDLMRRGIDFSYWSSTEFTHPFPSPDERYGSYIYYDDSYLGCDCFTTSNSVVWHGRSVRCIAE